MPINLQRLAWRCFVKGRSQSALEVALFGRPVAVDGNAGRVPAVESELVVLFDYRSKIWKKKYEIERNKHYDETQCDDCK